MMRLVARRVGIAAFAGIAIAAAPVPAGEVNDGGSGGIHAYHLEVAELRTQYLQALVRLEDRFALENDLESALIVRNEITRFRQSHLPPALLTDRMRPERLVALERIYVTRIATLEVGLAEATVARAAEMTASRE